MFSLASTHIPTEDQAAAARNIAAWLSAGNRFQTLLGVTGSGKTFTMASIIEQTQTPAIVISHNKTLAWQLYQEFKEYFPQNEVHYFVSYYDYYQPEAYLPSTDTYIEKDARINETIDKLRHAATQAVLTRKDVIIVASVSCIYNIGDPATYRALALTFHVGELVTRQQILRKLVSLQFSRNDTVTLPGTFSARGETVRIMLPTGEHTITLQCGPDTLERIDHSRDGSVEEYTLFPAKHFVTEEARLPAAIENIRTELNEQLTNLRDKGKLLEAARLEQRTHYDIEMLSETGYVSGIENYSRHLSFRNPDEPPHTLLDYFAAAHERWTVFVDESHISIPQIRGMYWGDRSRKETLVEHGFRLPSALDNRPLRFSEWEKIIPAAVFVSATPGDYEYDHSRGHIAEQLIRPTHILDPEIIIRPTERQIDDLIGEIQTRVKKGERTLVTVITKRLAEDLTERLASARINAAYLHSEIHTLDRPEILAELRRGTYDVLVGVNLLREGLDLPEVSLVAILDADKEGFLRNETTLIQTMGRAARHPAGMVIMYADRVTSSMKAALRETDRRRAYQKKYNDRHGYSPQPIVKHVASAISAESDRPEFEWMKKMSRRELERELKKSVKEWDFERAILIRDFLEESNPKRSRHHKIT